MIQFTTTIIIISITIIIIIQLQSRRPQFCSTPSGLRTWLTLLCDLCSFVSFQECQKALHARASLRFMSFRLDDTMEPIYLNSLVWLMASSYTSRGGFGSRLIVESVSVVLMVRPISVAAGSVRSNYYTPNPDSLSQKCDSRIPY